MNKRIRKRRRERNCQTRGGRLQPGCEGHLSDLGRGQKAIVLDFHNDNPALRRRLLDMGITKGVVIEIKKVAPLGDPVDILLRGYELCIRKKDMQSIDIRVIE
ncbi:MAG: FeoA family protein [Bacilli bacterium]|jgi:ferrous iron transport protein A|nr:FeoA family protein [Bacilli bacterium]